MKLAIFNEQYPAGTNAPTGTPSAPNIRVFNTTVANSIPGCTLDPTTGYITVDVGEYLVRAEAGLYGYLASQLSLTTVTGSPFAADGIPFLDLPGQGAQLDQFASVTGYLRADMPTTFKAPHFAGAPLFAIQSLGNDAGSGRPNVSAQITLIKTA